MAKLATKPRPSIEDELFVPPVEEPAKVEPGTKRPVDAMTFKMDTTFRRRFRMYAAEHDMQLNEVLRAAFDALLEKQP